jgi:hypothetical protein
MLEVFKCTQAMSMVTSTHRIVDVIQLMMDDDRSVMLIDKILRW